MPGHSPHTPDSTSPLPAFAGRTSLVIVADAHLGGVPRAVEDAFLDFADRVPTLGDALLLNGDLFEFWFGYRRVVPRRGFRAAAAIATLARRLPVVLVGGNHDRWGDDSWRDVGVHFAPAECRLHVGGRRVLAVHGDGLTEQRWSTRLLHRLVNHRVTSALYGAIHPDLGVPLVDRVTPALSESPPDEARLAAAEARQRAWAARRFAAEPALDVIVMGHTHRAAVGDVAPGKTYVNPGAWFEGFRYAVVTESAAELRRFGA